MASEPVLLVDQRTGLPVTSPTSVEMGEPDADLLADPFLFKSIRTMTTSSGLLVVVLNDSRTPSIQEPVILDVSVSSPGLLETTGTGVLERAQPGTRFYRDGHTRRGLPPKHDRCFLETHSSVGPC